MLSIFINLIFVSGFCFLLIVTLEYMIYLWENQKMNSITKDLNLDSDLLKISSSRDFTLNNESENFNFTPTMKNPLNSKYFERSLVLVKSQDYKGWLQKSIEVTKKVVTNLGFYTKKGFKYIMDLSKSGNNFPDHEEKHSKSDEANIKINDTINKLNKISANKTLDIENITLMPESSNGIDLKENINKDPNQGVATINLATEKLAKDITAYDKIERSILDRLQETGMTHYDIWLELGQFYQKYDKKQEAIEVFAMVMKHAEGKDKEQARDGLIALS